MNHNPKKIYAIDCGMVNASSMQLQKNEGRLFENLIYLDLRRRGDEIYYYVTADGYEIDFLTRDLYGKQYLYQVCWDMHDAHTSKRELRALQAAEQELGIKGTTITKDNYLSWLVSSWLKV
jgi:hypothetical protein